MNTEERKQKFLDALGQHAGNVSAACRAVGVSRNCYYKWRARDEEFARRCDGVTALFAGLQEMADTPSGADQESGPDDVWRRYAGRAARDIRRDAEKQITAALREAGHYTAASLPLVRAAATQCALMVMAFDEADRYAFHQTEMTAGGSLRLACNPAYEKISVLAERYARTLSRLGLQHDPRAGKGEDTLSDFFKQLDDD